MNIRDIIDTMSRASEALDGRLLRDEMQAIKEACIILEALADSPQAFLKKMGHPEVILHYRKEMGQSHVLLNRLLLRAQGIDIPDPAKDPEWIRKREEFKKDLMDNPITHDFAARVWGEET